MRVLTVVLFVAISIPFAQAEGRPCVGLDAWSSIPVAGDVMRDLSQDLPACLELVGGPIPWTFADALRTDRYGVEVTIPILLLDDEGKALTDPLDYLSSGTYTASLYLHGYVH